jgi:amidase
VQAAEAWRNHGAWIEAHPRSLGLDIEGRFRFGSTVDSELESASRTVLSAFRTSLLDMLGDDAWLALPAAGGPAHPRDVGPDEKDAWRRSTLRCSVPASAAGLPSVSVPTGRTPPWNIAYVGPPGADRALIAAVD